MATALGFARLRCNQVSVLPVRGLDGRKPPITHPSALILVALIRPALPASRCSLIMAYISEPRCTLQTTHQAACRHKMPSPIPTPLLPLFSPTKLEHPAPASVQWPTHTPTPAQPCYCALWLHCGWASIACVAIATPSPSPACLLTHLCHFTDTPGHHGQRPPVNLRLHSQMDNNNVRLCKNLTESICVLGYVDAHI